MGGVFSRRNREYRGCRRVRGERYNLEPLGMLITQEQFSQNIQEQVPFNLSLIPDFNSLIATSQLSNKPVFNLKEDDIKAYSNIYGAAMGTTKESIEKFRNLFSTLADDLERLMQVV